jgi:hypothetical protein
MGFLLGDTVPSVVVRDRLRRRYQVAELEVSLIHASIPASRLGEGHLELFLVPDQASDTRHIAAGERFGEDEAHLAFEAITPGPTLLQDLRRLVISECELRPDGGGYNPLDDSNGGGRTVLYFTAPARPGTQSWVHRLELTCSGHYPDVIDQHLDESTKADPLTPVPVRACTPPRSLVTGGA